MTHCAIILCKRIESSSSFCSFHFFSYHRYRVSSFVSVALISVNKFTITVLYCSGFVWIDHENCFKILTFFMVLKTSTVAAVFAVCSGVVIDSAFFERVREHSGLGATSADKISLVVARWIFFERIVMSVVTSKEVLYSDFATDKSH